MGFMRFLQSLYAILMTEGAENDRLIGGMERCPMTTQTSSRNPPLSNSHTASHHRRIMGNSNMTNHHHRIMASSNSNMSSHRRSTSSHSMGKHRSMDSHSMDNRHRNT